MRASLFGERMIGSERHGGEAVFIKEVGLCGFIPGEANNRWIRDLRAGDDDRITRNLGIGRIESAVVSRNYE